jgi:hypothetical protein
VRKRDNSPYYFSVPRTYLLLDLIFVQGGYSVPPPPQTTLKPPSGLHTGRRVETCGACFSFFMLLFLNCFFISIFICLSFVDPIIVTELFFLTPV